MTNTKNKIYKLCHIYDTVYKFYFFAFQPVLFHFQSIFRDFLPLRSNFLENIKKDYSFEI